jgi:putative FmdB family regulatory protein
METLCRERPAHHNTVSERDMPIFEYKCNACGNEFEELVFDRDECPPCPKCQSADTGKLMSAVRSKVGGFSPDAGGDSGPAAPSAPSSGCAGCSGGNCSSCG